MSAARMIAFARIAMPKTFEERPANFRASKLEGRASWLVEVGGVSWMVWDNGGEVGVRRINGGGRARFFPLDSHGLTLDEGTLFMRLWAVLRGDEIDFDERLDMTVFDLRTSHTELRAIGLI